MVSPIQWTWTWANFRRWWGTERPGLLQSVGSQRVGRDLETEQQHNILKLSVEMLKTYKVMQFSFPPSWHENVHVNYNNCALTKRSFDHYELATHAINNRALYLRHLAKLHCPQTYCSLLPLHLRDVKNWFMVRGCLIPNASQTPARQTKLGIPMSNQMKQLQYVLGRLLGHVLTPKHVLTHNSKSLSMSITLGKVMC